MTDLEKIQKIRDNPILWIELFGKIPDKSGKVVKLKMNPQQKYLMTNMQKYNIVLKSRQLGISSICMIYSLYLTLTKPNVTCLLMSHSMGSVSENFAKLRAMYDYLPDYVKLRETANNRTMLQFENHSKIICCTCGSKDNCRGSSIIFAHISEASSCKEENLNTQLVAIEQALVPGGKLIIESTAKGVGNTFHTLWTGAVGNENNYMPFFFPWWSDKGKNSMFGKEYKEFAELYKAREGHSLTVDELDETEQWLYDKGTTLEMLMWRRIKIRNNGESAFVQEFPSNDTEAFLNSDGANVFDIKAIHERLMGVDKYTKILKSPENLPKEVKPYKQYLKIWEYPQKGKRYYIGGDFSEGLSGKHDYSVIEVFDINGFQCAEFRTNKVKPYIMAEILWRLGLYFNRALMCIERASAGQTIISKLVEEYRYMNMVRYKYFDRARGKRSSKWGWETSQTSKPKMINDFVEMFETGQMCINSKELLNEMKVFQSEDGKMGAVVGSHDDTVMATALAIIAMREKAYYA